MPVVQSRHNERGKAGGKQRSTVLYNAQRGRWQRRRRKCHQKIVKKNFNFFRHGYQSTRFRVFSRYSAPAGRKASGPGKGGTLSVLLLMTELIVIYSYETSKPLLEKERRKIENFCFQFQCSLPEEKARLVRLSLPSGIPILCEVC